MLMVIPLRVDVPLSRRPWANYAILAACALVFAWQVAVPQAAWRSLLLGESALGWLGHMWLHADLLHLVGNSIFLWVFGNAVCAKLGNARYLGVYVGLGLVAALALEPFRTAPALGASGAIYGIVGFYTVLYFLNAIECVAVFFVKLWTFCCSSFWIIASWVALDLWGALGDGGPAAHAAHLGGFAAGFGLAFWLVREGRITMERHERSLPGHWGLIRADGEPQQPRRARRPSELRRPTWFEPPD